MIDRASDMRHILSQVAVMTGGTVMEAEHDTPASRMIADLKAQALPARISIYPISDAAVEATNLEASTPGAGQGRATVKAVLAAADKHGVTIEMEPFYDEGIEGGLDQDDLCKWYLRLGFQIIPNRDPDEDREQDRYWVRPPRLNEASRLRQYLTLVEETVASWFEQGTPVGDPAAVNDDCNDILEPGEWDWEWRLCRVPLDLIKVPNPNFHDEERMVRLRPQAEHAPVILSLSVRGVRLLDGYHRMKVARERGKADMVALVGKPRPYRG